MQLKFLKDCTGIYYQKFPKGTIHEYKPWNFDWQGMDEPTRVSKGIFVECHGMVEFNAWKKGEVKPI